MRKQVIRDSEWILIGIVLAALLRGCKESGYMARGLPDDSNVVKQAPTFNLSDMAELAARLGSPVNFIRYGDVMMLDDFEEGVGGWIRDIYSTDGFIRVSGTHTRSKGASLLLSGGTLVSTSVKLSRGLPVPVGDKVGWGYAFLLTTDFDRLIFGLVQTDAELNYHYTIKYDHNLSKLYYWDNFPRYVEFADLALRDGVDPFNLCKLVVNFNTHMYDKLYINDQVWDLSAYIPEQTGDPGVPDYFQVMVQATGDGIVSSEVYIDDGIVTENEF